MAGSAILSIRAIFDASRATRGIRETETATTRMGTRVRDTLKGVAAGFAAGFGAEKIVQGVKESITAASDLSETVSKTQQVFGSSAGAILDWSKNSSNAFGASRQEALDSAATFAIFGKAAGLTGGNLTSFSTDLTELASDFASFSNTSPEEAVNAIGAALRGETEPMRRFGLVLDQGSIQAEAFRLGLVKTAKEKVTPADRIQATQSLVKAFADGQKITGDFARTSGGLANQQRILQAKIENAKAAIGAGLLPVVLAGVSAFQKFGSWVVQNADWLKPLAIVVGVVGGAIAAATIATWAWGAAVAFLTSPVTLIIAAIALLVAGVIYAYNRFTWFRTGVQAIWSAIKTYITVYINIIKVAINVLMTVVRALVSAFQWMLSAARAVWNAHAAVIRAVVSGIRSTISGMISFFRNIPGWVRSALSTVGSIISAPFRAGWAWVRSNVISPIGGAFRAVPGAVRAGLSAVYDAITSPFRSAWDWVKRNVIDRVSGAFGTIRSGLSGLKGAYNSFARTWNGIEVKVGGKKMPGPIPDIPGFTFGLPDLPLLARGGYVDRATVAVIGEGRDDEIVSPVPMLRAIVRDELAAAGPSVSIVVNGALDPDAVARQIEKIMHARARRVGGITRAGAFT